jgi:AraC-like DNA-binding protein
MPHFDAPPRSTPHAGVRDLAPVCTTVGAFEPRALRSHRLFESDDLDEARERISCVMQPHRLRALDASSLGADQAVASRSHMDFMRIGGIGLGTIGFFGQPTRVDVEAVEDYHLLMFCLSGHAEVRADGRALSADTRHGSICAPGRAFRADLSADCEQFVLRMDRKMVQAHCGLQEGHSVRFHEELDLRRPTLQAWFDQVQMLASSTALMDIAQRHPLIAVEMERLLVHLLLEGQGIYDEVDDSHHLSLPAPGLAPACVKRAERYMEEHANEPLRLADIAAAADTPARTLLEAFKRFRNTSPMHYLRELRLERAHELLSQSESDPMRGTGQDAASVATIAFDCGFTHLGRFAQAYRLRFGVSPSATLARRGR